MANTALNRTGQFIGTNKSGGNLNYGDVVILDNSNNNGFTTTTTGAISSRGIGVILEPNGIANNATGMVASSGWVPKVNLNTSATAGQFIKTHTVAGQATPHASPQVEGDFGVVLDVTSATSPTAWLFGSPNGPTSGGSGTVTNTGTLANNALVKGNGGVDVSTITTGTGILTALGINTGSAGAPVLFNGALGTPSSGTLTSATGLPISTGVSGLGTGIATALAVNTGSAGAPALVGSTGLIAIKGYTPAANTTISTTSTTMAALDTTNLSVTFTAPSTGNVIVKLSCYGDISTNAQFYTWGLLDSSPALVSGVAIGPVRVADGAPHTGSMYVTGLTPGNSYTYRWAHAVTGGATGRVIIGPGVTSSTFTSSMFMPATMEVWAAP